MAKDAGCSLLLRLFIFLAARLAGGQLKPCSDCSYSVAEASQHESGSLIEWKVAQLG